KVTPEGGLRERHAKDMGMQPNLLAEATLSDGARMETSANTGVDPETVAHVRNWMQCVRDRNQKTNADIHAAYNHSVALCMTIKAIQTGKRVTFDDTKQNVVAG
ncbi:MAG TPA: gfo/Idh/MocA family oxidoreductase, partial [Blastocatellia bacterium]